MLLLLSASATNQQLSVSASSLSPRPLRIYFNHQRIMVCMN